jgi:DNA-binding CsgD family transcriptional regulator
MIEAVPKGCPLTPMGWLCARRVVEGKHYKEIAFAENVTVSTIRSHLSKVYSTLDVENAAQMVAHIMDAGWLQSVGSEWEDEAVTPAQRLFLDAFDVVLLGEAGARRFKETGVAKCDPPHSQRTPIEEVRAQGQLDHHLVSMAIEQGIPTPTGGKQLHAGRVSRETLSRGTVPPLYFLYTYETTGEAPDTLQVCHGYGPATEGACQGLGEKLQQETPALGFMVLPLEPLPSE